MKFVLKKFVSLAFIFITLFSAIVFPSSADTGPKPSVRVNFKNMGDELCYGTLLSEHPSTGPSSVWDGNEDHAQHKDNEDYAWVNTPYEVWYALVNYADSDGYYFLQDSVWQVNETKELSWTYYPPSRFKILLYYPESNTFAASGICERYAFDSYYTVDMDGVNMGSVEYDDSLSSNDRLNAYKSYKWQGEFFSLLARIGITIAVEMLIALLFKFKGKDALILLATVNTATQVILNLLLNLINFKSGELSFIFGYLGIELLIFIVEAFIYSVFLKRIDYMQKTKTFYIIYSLAANTASFIVGLGIALVIPGIF